MALPSGVPWRHSLLVLFYLFRDINGYTETYWQVAVPLSQYSGYQSAQLKAYHVPIQATESVWLFKGIRTPDDCPVKNLVIYIQHGSYPLINPRNETFPARFYHKRTELHRLSLPSNNRTVEFIITQPLAGSWYSAAFIDGEVDDSINLKGLGPGCRYLVGTTQITSAIELQYVREVFVDTPVSQSVYRESELLRFYLSDDTWQFTLELQNCTYKPPVNSSTGNVTSCPLLLQTKARAIPVKSQHQVNCSAVPAWKACTLQVTSPEAGTWQFITLTRLHPGQVNFVLHIHVEECEYVRRDWVTVVSTPTSVTEDPSNHSSTGTTVYPPAYNHSQLHHHLTQQNASSRINIHPYIESTKDDPDFGARVHSKVRRDVPIQKAGVYQIPKCAKVPKLGRYALITRAFTVKFSLRINGVPFTNHLQLEENVPLSLKFDIDGRTDIGGTLRYVIQLDDNSYNKSSGQGVGVRTCVQRGRIPVNENGTYCDQENFQVVNSTADIKSHLYFPYPEPGTWYITLQTYCYRLTNPAKPSAGEWVEEQCYKENKPRVDFAVNLSPCVDSDCGFNGNCHEYYNGQLHFSVCRCIAGWRGYGCTDGSHAEPAWAQLRATLLLSLSNLAFIFSIVVALYRRFYVEALVYFYTMFFSTFYHACDGDRHYLWCMMPYKVLAHCDFFGSILSFWVTLVAMARLREQIRSFLFMLAALAVAMGVQWDRHNVWTFLVPAGTALGLMLVTWAWRCHQRHSCYPSKKRWLFFLLPGSIFAGIGLIIFAFLETERNYQFTHSAWHACMAFSIVFLLPPRKPPTENKADITDTSVLVLHGPAETRTNSF